MKKKKMLLVSVVFIALSHSCLVSSPERNKLIFKNPATNVNDSLCSIINLLNRISYPKAIARHYKLDEHILYINAELIGDIDTITCGNNKLPLSFSVSQKGQFLNLCKYLSENYISGCYEGYNQKIWYFDYHALKDNEFNDVRNIVSISQSKDLYLVEEWNDVLDKVGNLYLVAPKGAKIY